MQGIPSYYGADDLLLNALYDEGSKICGNRPYPKAPDFPPDSFDGKSKTSENSKLKKGLTIGGLVAAAGLAIAGIWKLVKKFKP